MTWWSCWQRIQEPWWRAGTSWTRSGRRAPSTQAGDWTSTSPPCAAGWATHGGSKRTPASGSVWSCSHDRARRMTRRLLFSYLAFALLILVGLEVPLGYGQQRNEQHEA